MLVTWEAPQKGQVRPLERRITRSDDLSFPCQCIELRFMEVPQKVVELPITWIGHQDLLEVESRVREKYGKLSFPMILPVATWL